LFIVANGLGRIAGDLISPRVFERGGMQTVAVMAAAAALCALAVVVGGVREVGATKRERGPRQIQL
jgi:predicted MFS family arabinose efflux permease